MANPKKISPTLAEYAGGADANKIYVQFADESPEAEALRIELFCEAGERAKDPQYGCGKLYDKLVPGHHSFKTPHVTDARITRDPDQQWLINTMDRRLSSYIAFGRILLANRGLSGASACIQGSSTRMLFLKAARAILAEYGTQTVGE